MSEVICFTCDRINATRFLDALLKDFYKGDNIFAAGNPFFIEHNNKALFFCPMIIPIPGKVGDLVKKTVFRGLKHSANNAGISLVGVKFDDEMRGLYEQHKEKF